MKTIEMNNQFIFAWRRTSQNSNTLSSTCFDEKLFLVFSAFIECGGLYDSVTLVDLVILHVVM
jgi:hypothetical protein